MSGGVPAGWVLVPVEPTQEMVDNSFDLETREDRRRGIWACMLAATPTPPIEGRDADVERVARAMCVADGLDPDEHIIGGQATGFEDFGPLWQAEDRSERTSALCGKLKIGRRGNLASLTTPAWPAPPSKPSENGGETLSDGLVGLSHQHDHHHYRHCAQRSRAVGMGSARIMTDDLVGRLRKRASQHGMLLSDPPKPSVENALLSEAAARIEALEAEADTAAELLALVLWADPGVKEAAARKAARDWWVKRDEAIRAALTPEAPHAD